MDLTTGSLPKKIIIYSLPLMCSNILQVLFNLSDVAIVGKFSGPIALGSVGSTTTLITLTTGILIGMGVGVNAVVARLTGAKDYPKIKRSIQTSFLLCLFIGIIMLMIGLTFSKKILQLIGTKAELITGAQLYLTIYLLGSPAMAIYNYGNAVLSAVGDTRRPLKYLTISGILNVILNLLFVICFHLDVMGVALASIITQYLSAFLIMRFLLICKTEYGLSLRDFTFDGKLATKVLAIGIPSGLQNILFSISNLFIQSAINSFDHVVVEGNTAGGNADGIVYDIMAAFYTACTSFIAQNYGAGKRDRILKIYFWTLFYANVIALLLGGLLVIFKTPFLSLFTDDSEVIKYGKIRLGIMGCTYFISAFMDNAVSGARGLGKSIVPTTIIISGTVVFRTIWLLTVFNHFHTLPSLYLVYCVSWIFTAIIGNLYFAHVYRGLPKEQFVLAEN